MKLTLQDYQIMEIGIPDNELNKIRLRIGLPMSSVIPIQITISKQTYEEIGKPTIGTRLTITIESIEG